MTGASDSRRTFLQRTACGLGSVGLASLLSAEDSSRNGPAAGGVIAPHFAPTAKSVIFLFMAGAPSQLDLFDPKPAMQRLHGQPVPQSFLAGLDDALIRGSARVFASPRRFDRYGQCGMQFSDFMPHMGACADDLCMIRSMTTDVSNHHPAQLLMNCGMPRFGLPSMGAWTLYGLGSASQNLPGFVVMLSKTGSGDLGGSALWGNAFLPAKHRGVTLRGSGEPILHLDSPAGITPPAQRLRLDAVNQLNRQRQLQRPGDRVIGERIDAYELAFRMQMAAPELADFSNESAATLRMYGVDEQPTHQFGANCLMARRMVERGVRFVQLYHYTWDDHSNLNEKLAGNCRITDQPAAALIRDLKRRGMLDETLVVWGGEFGRTPMNEVRRGNSAGKEGRDHHPFAFTMLAAGGGVKGGQVIGRTDELGYHVVDDKVHVHDLQATMLHCLGLDHQRLTYRHQGRDFRLTDVGGRVVRKMLG